MVVSVEDIERDRKSINSTTGYFFYLAIYRTSSFRVMVEQMVWVAGFPSFELQTKTIISLFFCDEVEKEKRGKPRWLINSTWKALPL